MADMRTDTPSTAAENRIEPMTEMPSEATPEMASEPTPMATTESASRRDSILIGPDAAAVAPTAPARHRPIMVTILAMGAGILALLSAVHLLQALGIIPFVIGRVEIRAFSLFHAIMWGLMVWVWGWVVQMLWKVEPQAWIFLVVVSMFNLVLDFVLLLGDTSWSDVSISFLVNAVILLYCLLPGTRRVFDHD